MINNWKLGIKILRYAHGIKMNIIVGIVMLLLNIPVVIAGVSPIKPPFRRRLPVGI